MIPAALLKCYTLSMLYSAFLVSHIAIGSIAVLLLVDFSVRIFRDVHTQTQAKRVSVSTMFTIVSGLLLLVGGASISHVCIMLSVYTAASFLIVHIAKKKGFTYIEPQSISA